MSTGCVNCKEIVNNCLCVRVDYFFAKAKGVPKMDNRTKPVKTHVIGLSLLSHQLDVRTNLRIIAKHRIRCGACRYGMQCDNVDRLEDKCRQIADSAKKLRDKLKAA